MRISLNWLKKYVNINVSNDELIRLIGARLVEIEDVIDETHKYDNIYVVKVVECEPIEGTHLHLCKLHNDIQVVCGAPNVHAGMLTAWIAPGAIVPQSIHEDAPFVIGTRKMLGKYESHGMLAGADELDFGDDHSGIIEIDPAVAKPDDKLADIFDLNDIILDIENKSLTHRPDCFGLIGFAREVAGILGQKFTVSENSNFPDNKTENVFLAHFGGCCRELAPEPREDGREGRGAKNTLSVAISDATLCPRYSALLLTKHGEIKKKYLTWQDTILSKSGMKPISPIVDATNYLMLLTGQPLHAFDYDKFVTVGKTDTPKIIVRAAKPGEKLTLLDDKEIELNETDIVITSNDIPVALAGAMGGESTMIDENTKNILLESATFSLYNLRKTQMAHGIFSEAITRFTKGQPAYQTVQVAKACAELLRDGFEIAELIDEYPHPQEPSVVKITTDEINSLLGTAYSPELIISTLENVGFRITGQFEIHPPLWRTDIHIKEDIIEEVGRLLGYDNITPTLPLHATATKNPLFELKKRIRNLLVSKNAHEVLTYSFISEKLLKDSGQDPANSYKIINSISPELQYVRQSLIPSLLDKAYLNLKIPYDSFALFEMNKVYQKSYGLDEDNVPNEHAKLAIVVADRKSQADAYYQAKLYLEELSNVLGLKLEFHKITTKDVNSRMLEPKRAAEVSIQGHSEICLGVIGELKTSISHNFKLPKFVAAVELDLDTILAATAQYNTASYGQVAGSTAERDITITTTKTYAEIYNAIEQIIINSELGYKIKPVSIYQPADKTAKNISFHLELSTTDKNLSQDKIASLMANLEKIS